MLFDFISTVSQHRQTQTFTLDLWQRSTLYPDQSKVTFQIQTCSLSSSCFCNLSIIIQSGETSIIVMAGLHVHSH